MQRVGQRTSVLHRFGCIGSVILCMSGGSQALAQDGGPLSGDALIASLEAMRTAVSTPKNVTLLGIPSGTAASGGLVFGSVSGTTRRNGGDDDEVDGSAAFGIGLGDASDSVALQFTVSVTSMHPDDIGDSGAFGVKVSRQIARAVPTYASLSANDLGGWGDAEDRDVSYNAAITALPEMTFGTKRYPLMLTVGVGSDVRDLGTEPGIFAGAGVGLTEYLGTSIAYNGNSFDLGASVKMPGVNNVGLSVTANDIFDQDDSQRLTFSVNWYTSVFGG